ncbi:hypothetical protein [Kibdelosporangium philippinense]|uniref:hypothetical protein n=1 Tax=Kibdelosporangium philippinense TaxID=211113 RepID=UPI00360B2FB4
MVDTREGGAMRDALRCKPRKRQPTRSQAKADTPFSNGGHTLQERSTRPSGTVDTAARNDHLSAPR